MRVLWFTNTPSLFKRSSVGYNGGGWIEALEMNLRKQDGVELAISFFYNDNCFKQVGDRVTYYPIALNINFLKRVKQFVSYRRYEREKIVSLLKVIDDFRPDVIHVFGTEMIFGLITQYIKVPVVIHLQGLLNPCINAWLPPSTNLFDFRYAGLLDGIKLLKRTFQFRVNAKREIRIFKNCKYFIGRTDWDREIVKLYSPNSKYFYGSEILRPFFYDEVKKDKKMENKIKLITTISKVTYKGFDVILKTALLLKQYGNIDFIWEVYGINEFRFWERKLKIKSEAVNIKLMGSVNEVTLGKAIVKADVFVHPSYIDNSPNSICEAQILGCPVISTNVGGISSLIVDRETGLLVPANDPFMTASRIVEIMENRFLYQKLSVQAKNVAQERHKINEILRSLMTVYKSIL